MAQRFIPRHRLSGKYMSLAAGAGSSLAHADGLFTFQAWDLAAPVVIDITYVECVTTPGGVGSVWHGAWWFDNGTFDAPGALMLDLGTVDTTTTGMKPFNHGNLALPAGRVWFGGGAQGAAAPAPTMRVASAGYNQIPVSVNANTLNWALTQNGQAAGVPNPPVPNGGTNVPISALVHFV